jgi:hypothetical protein
MKSISASATTALESPSLGFAQLVAMEFSGSPIYLNSTAFDLPSAGTTYLAAQGLGRISPITDQPGQINGVELSLSGTSTAMISLALDSADIVQGTPLTIRNAIVSTSTFKVLDAPILWSGYLDTMSIQADGETRTISVTAESRMVDLMRGSPWYYTDADQRIVNANDASFSFVLDQIDKPVIWPARAYYLK